MEIENLQVSAEPSAWGCTTSTDIHAPLTISFLVDLGLRTTTNVVWVQEPCAEAVHASDQSQHSILTTEGERWQGFGIRGTLHKQTRCIKAVWYSSDMRLVRSRAEAGSLHDRSARLRAVRRDCEPVAIQFKHFAH